MILTADNVTLSLAGRDILRGLTVELAPGELALLSGPPGSGKTAFGLAACGCAGFIGREACVTGSLSLIGSPVVQGVYRREAGIVLENPYAQTSGMKQTVGGELAFPLECRGVPPVDIRSRVGEFLSRLGIADLNGRRIGTLSGGELQRVVIGASLIARPRFLFLDRPLTEIDTAFRGTLLGLFEDDIRRCEGAAILAEDPWLLPPHRFQREIRLGEEVSSPDTALTTFPAMSGAYSGGGGKPALAVESLSFAYPGAHPLFTGLDVTVPAGGIMILEGPNGSGKTTLAKLIAGILRPRAGSIIIGGRDADTMSRPENMALVGLSPQNPGVILCRRTVGEEVSLAKRWGNDPSPLIGLLGLDSLGDRHPLELTKAAKKRLGIALAYGPRRQVIILDEPSQYQDGEDFRRVVHAVCAMAGEGKAVIIISHDPRFREVFPEAPVTRLDRADTH